MREAALKKAVMDWLGYHKIFAWPVWIGAIRHQKGGRDFYRKNPMKGFPDVSGVLQRARRGVFFAIEIKSDDGKLRPEQTMWLVDLQAAGAACAVIRSLDDLERVMREWGEV